jgi:DNA replication protein DnaC
LNGSSAAGPRGGGTAPASHYASVKPRGSPGKTFETLDTGRFPLPQLLQLTTGAYLETATNVLAFGLPGVGKSHTLCAVAHALVDGGHRVLFTPAFPLVQKLLAAKRAPGLPRALRKLDLFEAILIDDIGYVQQSPDEAEVLFTLLAERYERPSVMITGNLVFSQWERISRTRWRPAQRSIGWSIMR